MLTLKELVMGRVGVRIEGGGVGWDWSRTIWRIVFLGSTEVFGEGEGTTRISTIPRGESLS